jgi:hypothetical protein
MKVRPTARCVNHVADLDCEIEAIYGGRCREAGLKTGGKVAVIASTKEVYLEVLTEFILSLKRNQIYLVTKWSCVASNLHSSVLCSVGAMGCSRCGF